MDAEMRKVEIPRRVFRSPQRWFITPGRELPSLETLLAQKPLLAQQPVLTAQVALTPQGAPTPQVALTSQVACTPLTPQAVLTQQQLSETPLSLPQLSPPSPAPAPIASGSGSHCREDSESEEEPLRPPAKVLCLNSYSYLSFC